METTIDQLTEALENSQGRTPREVVDAFCPVGRSIGPFPLVPLKAGHDLFLTRIGHPLVAGNSPAWGPQDLATLLFAFTRPSRDLCDMIEDGTFSDALHEFLDEIPLGLLETAAADLVAHWIRARDTALAMGSPHAGTGSKKKAGSAGGSR